MDKKIKGIVVSERSYSETSKIINILTEEDGIIGLIAKGAKGLKSPLRNVTTKLTYGLFNIRYKEKGLSTGEKKMLNNAKQILVSELVLTEHATQDEIENIVENKINNSFEEFKVHNDVDVSAMSDTIVKKFIPFDGNMNA